MKRAIALVALAALLCCLAGCMGSNYTEGEKDAAGKKGEKMMSEWLERSLPGAELVSAEAYISHYTGVAPYKLTDLVTGTLSYGGEEQTYWLNSTSGEVWFEQSEETMDALSALCGAYAAKALGLEGCLLVGHSARYYIGAVEQPNVLPAEYVVSGKTPEDFLRSPEGREALPCTLSYSAPDDFALSDFALADTCRALEGLRDGYGIEATVDVLNGSEYLVLGLNRAYYTRQGFIDLPDFRVRATVCERVESVDPETGKVTTEITERGASDLSVERTADGWKTGFPNGYFNTEIYAYDGSDMLEHEYVLLKDPDAANDYDKPLAWKKTDLGWALCFTDRDEVCYLSDRHELAEKK